MLTRYAARVRAAFGAAGTSPWWDEVLEAAFRQLIQVVTPFLLLVVTTRRLDAQAGKATALVAGTAVLLVVLRRLAALTPPPDAGWDAQLYVRAASAFAGALAGAMTADGLDVLTAPWSSLLLTAALSALLALVHGEVDPPATMAVDLAVEHLDAARAVEEI